MITHGTVTIKIGTASGVTKIGPEEYVVLQCVRKNLPDILLMLDHGVFDFKRGRAILHRDNEGELRKIEMDLTTWSK